MLQRIISIRNVGRFRNCNAAGDVTFRRLTLVFAENGRGKTTLCAILRSLATNMPALILGRRTLGAPGQPEVQLLTAGGNVVFRDGAWSAALPDIAVFDGAYISENVFAGDVVGTEHRRNLYRVIIGARGVTLAARITELDDQIRRKNDAIRENRTLLRPYLPAGMSVEAFCALPEDPDIDARIAAREQDLHAARRAAELQERPALAPVAVPIFPAAYAQLLAKSLEDVAADAGERIAAHVERHRMQAGGEAWLSEGLGYVTADECPFCGQALAGNELIKAYQSFFSREYHALREEVATLRADVDAALGERAAAAIARTVLQNENSAAFWRQYCDIAPLDRQAADSAGEAMGALRRAAEALLQVKAAAPLEAVAPDERFTHSVTAFEEVRVALGAYNAAVAAANAIIATRKRQAQAANVRDVEADLGRLKAQKARHADEEARRRCTDDRLLERQKAELEAEKAQVREQLDAHTQQVIERYGQSINRYLERINAGFRITTPAHTYRGGTPSTTYQILINQTAVDLGDAATPADRPSFRNTLSAGDRSTLALAFFLAQLEQDEGRTRKVVVFDDPFTSLDGFRRSHTANQIYRCGEACSQVVLLSHEPNFLHLLWERIAPADRKTLALVRVGEEDTTITEWDIERAVQAPYRRDIDTLLRYFSDGEDDPRNVVQKIRPVLEAYCRYVCPTQFGEQDMMGTMVAAIRAAGGAHPLHPIVDDLDEVNLYSRRYHHPETGRLTAEPIDDAELQGYVRRTLKLVGISDPVSLDTGLTNDDGDQGGRYGEKVAEGGDGSSRGGGGQRGRGAPGAVERAAEDGIGAPSAPR
jgi:wobble nucleotide-excising tRNase